MADEFSLIETWLAPLSRDIGDDCALLELDAGERLAISVDTMVEGVHFLPDSEAGVVAYRAVVTALSDLAAMGACPRGITLALTLPRASDDWMRDFSAGLARVLRDYDVLLLGGDTTRGPLTVTVQVMGSLPRDAVLLRSGAVEGDLLCVSGTPGDAAAGLAVQQGGWTGGRQYTDYLLQRFLCPSARIALGQELLGFASSAIDISDGLLADAEHLSERSRVGIEIDAQSVPLSEALKSIPDRSRALEWALSGGDDYELLFTVPADQLHRLPAACTRIGVVRRGEGVSCDFQAGQAGYRHFDHADSPGGQS